MKTATGKGISPAEPSRTVPVARRLALIHPGRAGPGIGYLLSQQVPVGKVGLQVHLLAQLVLGRQDQRPLLADQPDPEGIDSAALGLDRPQLHLLDQALDL